MLNLDEWTYYAPPLRLQNFRSLWGSAPCLIGRVTPHNWFLFNRSNRLSLHQFTSQPINRHRCIPNPDTSPTSKTSSPCSHHHSWLARIRIVGISWSSAIHIKNIPISSGRNYKFNFRLDQLRIKLNSNLGQNIYMCTHVSYQWWIDLLNQLREIVKRNKWRKSNIEKHWSMLSYY